MKEMDFRAKNALVCGSTQGIGRAIAEELARRGAAITLAARNEEVLQQVRQGLARDDGQQHEIIVADFNNSKGLRSRLEEYFNDGRRVHILINNSGGPPGGPIAAAREEEFELAFGRHLLCNHVLAQACLPGMRAAGYGRIINIISTSVKQPIPGLGVSNTIRGAVANWAKTLAAEVAAEGITVNNVLPGATATGRLESILQKKAAKTGATLNDVEEAARNEIPAGRFGEPWEVAIAAVFLASPLAAYINGVNLPVDGGRLACL